jgi:hypothetical protein
MENHIFLYPFPHFHLPALPFAARRRSAAGMCVVSYGFLALKKPRYAVEKLRITNFIV